MDAVLDRRRPLRAALAAASACAAIAAMAVAAPHADARYSRPVPETADLQGGCVDLMAPTDVAGGALINPYAPQVADDPFCPLLTGSAGG
jgi:hypothetical protein